MVTVAQDRPFLSVPRVEMAADQLVSLPDDEKRVILADRLRDREY
jgi:hypothetical protein